MELKEFRRISEFEWEIPRDFQAGMKVPVVVFADESLIKKSLKDASMQQAINAASLPGVISKVCIMPDVHQGYGFPIGGVAATSIENGIISPGAIGYDINCGVRLMASNVNYQQAKSQIEKLIVKINSVVPSGVGKGGKINLARKELEAICIDGAQWAREKGFTNGEDIDAIESFGRVDGANPSQISQRAIQRGMPQLGSLGSGNHFIEVGVVTNIFDTRIASRLGIWKDNIVIQIHSGSRGLGHQICSDYVKSFQKLAAKYHYNLPDRELVCAPIKSKEGRSYLAAMRCAANYAFANRQMLAFSVREVFESIFSNLLINARLMTVYDLAHNIGKIEEHIIDGGKQKLCIHRKGATRAFGPGHKSLPEKYQTIGQPVLIPGSMGTSSWVMRGTAEAGKKSFSSCSHGAGRVMSRSKARKTIRGEKLLSDLQREGILIKSRSMSGLAEEAPHAYKDVDRVIQCVEGAQLALKVARLKPLAVIKG